MVWISIVDQLNRDVRKPILHRSPFFQSFPITWVLTKYIKTLANFSLNISPNAIPRPLINSHYTLTFTNVGFHDCFAKHLSKVWFHLVHYRQSKHFLQLHTIHTTKKCAGIHLDHIVLYLSPKATISNISAQLLAHFWEIPCNLLLSPNWSEVQLIILEPMAKLKSGPNLKKTC